MLGLSWEARKNVYDYIIVGSGYGGAIFAARLASADLNPKASICLLELGREWPVDTFPDRLDTVLAAQRNDLNPLGLYEFLNYPDISVIKGSGLGGTSLVNANVAIIPDAEVFKQSNWPRTITRDVLMPYYFRAQQALAAVPYPRAMQLAKVQGLDRRAVEINQHAGPMNIAVNFSINGKNPFGVDQKPCTDCGDCITGCNVGAKNTLYMNFLPMARNAGAEIYTQTKVEWIEKLAGGGWRIHGRHIDDDLSDERFTLDAKNVVLSAGAINSPEILLRSEMHGLSVSPVLGTGFSGNGDFFGLAYNGDFVTNVMGYGLKSSQPGDATPPGPTIVGIIRYNGNAPLEQRFAVEDLSFPSAYIAGAKAAFALLRGEDTVAGNEAAQEQRCQNDSDFIHPYRPDGALNHTMLYLVMGHDDARGTMVFDAPWFEPDGRMTIQWDGAGRQIIFTRINEELRRHARALRGNFISNPLWNIFNTRHLVTAHPLGGCPLGEDYLHGAADEFGRVFAGDGSVHEGLFVCDGSLVPSALMLGIGCTAVAQGRSGPGSTEPPQVKRPGAQGNIRFAVEQIPLPLAFVPVFKLSSQKPPTDFVQEVLRRTAPDSKGLSPLSENPQFVEKGGRPPTEFVGAFSEGHLAAYLDTKGGDAKIFPSFTRQTPIPVEEEGSRLERAIALAREVFARPDILQKDATEVSFEKPRALYSESAEKAEAGARTRSSPREIYLTYVPVRRSVERYFVYGLASRALLVVGNDGSVQGFVRRWKTATRSGEVHETRSREQVAEAIRAQLRPIARSAEVEVLSIEIAYYDGNREFLQPVYRFTARVHQVLPEAEKGLKAQARRVDDDFVVGYVPIGKEVESLPSLVAPHGPPPATPRQRTAPRVVETPGDPSVGRYVVRNDDSNWVADANEFWGGLTSWFGGALFTNSQYFWAYPFEFNTSEAAFVNSVNIALNEVHGDWWLFSTRSNCCDLVDITTIPATEGYGSANGGNLCYWVLHSCEVVPSAADAPCPSDSRSWWTPWFNIFRGLHTVVGYRTIMWIDDDVGGPYGVALRFGAPVVSAWFNATTSAAGYQGNPTYQAHCGNSPPMGRPSTVSYCGRENDWVYDTTPLPAANCLINFWQPN